MAASERNTARRSTIDDETIRLSRFGDKLILPRHVGKSVAATCARRLPAPKCPPRSPQDRLAMPRHRPKRLAHIAGIGVDRMGAIADADARRLLRLENLDTDIPPDPEAIVRTCAAAGEDDANSYLPFVGQLRLRTAAAAHVSRLSGVSYRGDRNVVIAAGGLSGILNVLLATVEDGDEVIVTDPTYAGLINRVRLAGGVPRFAPFIFEPGAPWRLDRDGLAACIGPKTRAMLLMSPSMPSGGTFDDGDWATIADLCVRHDLLLILDSAMERLLFDGRRLIHPAGFAGMAERTITVGAASKELRMIGWRVGWIVAPEPFMADIAAVSMANVVVPVGIAQDAAAVALERSRETLPAYVEELQRRRDTVLAELEGLPVGVPGGGWSLLLRVSDYGLDGAAVSQRLLAQDVCATPMQGWGAAHGAQYIRFVFANEPVPRLQGLGRRVRAALGAG
ncbi:MAG: pyridoxal phosphate-dependent aminotransferase [Rhodospirillaceae bacterium]|nr:pyridoxal phosphate-dependent aminotransferase [Rhodospirillaceae bacterium]